jgi:O-methyltransferase
MSTLDEVKKKISKEFSNSNIYLIKGKVEDTLLIEKNISKKISILRLDTDFYESTKIELELLYPQLETGGVLIIDDYGNYKGARKAVNEYFKSKPFLIYVDHSCRLLIKN